MFKSLFRPDSPLMIVMSQITDCIFLSLFFLLGCVPVVTIGASLAALYDATFRGFRDGERNSWQRFLRTYRRNCLSGILPTLVFLLLGGGLVYGVVKCWNALAYEQISWGLFAAVALVAVVVVGVLSVLFPMLSRFENGLGALLKNTLFLSLANLPRTLVLGIWNTVVILCCARLVLPLFFLPALAALIGSLLIEPMFRPYMKKESQEEAAQ